MLKQVNEKERFKDIRLLMDAFSGLEEERKNEVKNLKRLLNEAELDMELKLKENDIDGYASSKGAVEFYTRKIQEFKEKEPLKIDSNEIYELATKERDKIVADFEKEREPLEKMFLEVLEGMGNLFQEKQNALNELNLLISKHDREVGAAPFRMLKDIKVITKERFLEIERYPRHGSMSSIMIEKK